jgi:hypothetical protein
MLVGLPIIYHSSSYPGGTFVIRQSSVALHSSPCVLVSGAKKNPTNSSRQVTDQIIIDEGEEEDESEEEDEDGGREERGSMSCIRPIGAGM